MPFCKELIGVQKQTSNLGVLIELGRIPPTIYAKKNCIKNWERIGIKKNSNHLVKTLYEWDLQKNIGWPKTIRDYLSGIELMDIFLDERSRKPANIEAFIREKDIFHQTTFYEIQNNSSKLKTYSKFKKTVGIEYYLHKIKDRISMTKLRLSNHKLRIEKGRHNNIESCSRFCPFCPKCLEDEYHLLMLCPAYSGIRLKLRNQINTENRHVTNELLFIYLMTENQIISHTAEFISNADDIRDLLLKNTYNLE